MAGIPEKFVLYAGTSASVRRMLDEIVTPRGIRMRAFRSVEAGRVLLTQGGCDLIVVELNGDTPDELHSLVELKHEYPQTPVLVLVDHGDILTAVRTIKAGAINCLEKPVETESLIPAVDEALEQANASPSATQLTPTEMTVLQHMLRGRTSRQIADVLCRSPRTIEVHRSHIMHKLGVSTMVDLVRTASAMGLFET